MTQKVSFEYHREQAMPGKGPGIVMQGLSKECFDEIRAFVSNNYMRSMAYQAKRGVDPFLQGEDRQSGWLFIEFWGSNPERRNAYAELIHKIFLRIEMSPMESIPQLCHDAEVMRCLYEHYTQTPERVMPFQYNGHVMPVLYSLHNPNQSDSFELKGSLMRVQYLEWKGDGPLFILCAPQPGLRFPKIVRLYSLNEHGDEVLHDFSGATTTQVATIVR